MTNWRPPRSVVERNQRAIRSMQNGSLDGRIVTAFPVKSRIEEDYDEEDETEEEVNVEDPGGGPEKGVLIPVTEYFRLGSLNSIVFNLQFRPYKSWVFNNGSQAPNLRQYSTVHLYWNNIFQNDMSYKLIDQTIVILDSRSVLKLGDIITVKYWYTPGGGGGGGGGGPTVAVHHLEGWFAGGSSYQRYLGLGGQGITDCSPGTNGGKIKTLCTHYSTVGYLSNFGGAVRLPKSQDIDLHGATDAVVQLRFPLNANVSCFGYSNTNGRVGGVVWHKFECGLGGDSSGSLPPSSLPPFVGGGISPTIAIGGTTTHSGAAGLQFAQHADTKVGFDGTHQTIPILCKDGGPTGSNSGCAGFGDPTFFDDTIYGKATMHATTYDGTFGGTIVVLKDRA